MAETQGLNSVTRRVSRLVPAQKRGTRTCTPFWPIAGTLWSPPTLLTISLSAFVIAITDVLRTAGISLF